MKNYTYAIVHDGAQFLVFKKKKHGHFFGRNAVAPAVAAANPLNGGGKFCFPGGALNHGEAPVVGARREFREETGVSLPTDVINTRVLTESTGHGCFIKIEAADLIALHQAVTDQLALANGKNGEWKNAACHVQDNELKKPELVALANLPGTYFVQDDPDTGWFHSFMSQFR